jgi:hypothetical protein
MGFDPATMEAVASTVQAAKGTDSVQGITPPPFLTSPGQFGGPMGAINQLGGLNGPMSGLGLLARANNFGNPIEQGKNAAEDAVGPPITAMGPGAPGTRTTDEQPPVNPFSGFFGNLDNTLGSPAKLLGLGLLGQIDPRLGAAGLLAGGLLGKNKVFPR